MASWILVPSLVRLRSDFNAIAPGRDKSSDGSIGDEAHQGSQSDHNADETGNVPIRDTDRVNEVHALDVDVDLRAPGLSMEMVVQHLLARCRLGRETRLRYIIFNRRIWTASNKWRQENYTGASPHDHHAHFSASYATQLEALTDSWHLEDIPVALTADDKKWITAEIEKAVGRVSFTAPSADQVAEAVFRKVRQSPTTFISDTGVNRIGAEITEAVIAGEPIKRYPANDITPTPPKA